MLMLRSRVFTQIPHVLPPRLGALAVGAWLWIGPAGDHQVPPTLVILLTAVGFAIAMFAVTRTPGASPIASARIGRAMDLAELALVVILVVLAAALLGGAEWVVGVIG